MAAQPEASTVVRATVEASTVVAHLLEAATEVAAEATVVESTRSIQIKFKSILLNPSGQGPTLPLAQFRVTSVHLVFSLLSPRSYMSSAGNYEHRAIPFFWSNGSWCIAIPHWVPL